MGSTTTTETESNTGTVHNSVVQAQLNSLDDTDCYASAWADALRAAQTKSVETNATARVQWGGRGKGGRGIARRTIQTKDIVVDDVRLAYLGGHSGTSDSSSGVTKRTDVRSNSTDACLDGATLKLLNGHVYALLGRNGCGKSTLLRRIDAGKIPGLSPHFSTLYVPQELLLTTKTTPISTDSNSSVDETDTTSTETKSSKNSELASLSPIETVLRYYETCFQRSTAANKLRIAELEEELDGLDLEDGDLQQQEEVERICEQISALEDEEIDIMDESSTIRQQARDALTFFGIEDDDMEQPCSNLSGGQLRKVILSTALFCKTDLLLLDEPTNHLDVYGLIQLRQLILLCQQRSTTILMVSHDADLMNDVATDIIHFSNRKLYYYPGNYDDFKLLQQQQGLHELRQHAALEKKREHMLNTLENLKKQPVPKRGGAKKKARAIESHKKKLERQGIEKDDKGHRWTQQKQGTGLKKGSINSIDATTRRGLSSAQLLKQAQKSSQPVPDKAVQFIFRNTTCKWGEPLITAMDIGHGYDTQHIKEQSEQTQHQRNTDDPPETIKIMKKNGYLFDCLDLCVEEGSTICILGKNGFGKSTLLRVLAGLEKPPLEGKIHHSSGIRIGYFDQKVVDSFLQMIHGENTQRQRNEVKTKTTTTALSFLMQRFPTKTEQELRAELTGFGLSPTLATTVGVQFLSGGERCRLCLANLMLEDPPILFMDNPTSNLDVESVEALIHGLSQWNGTLVLVSHDANFIRSLDANCFALMHEEGKLRRVEGGIDAYLNSFKP